MRRGLKRSSRRSVWGVAELGAIEVRYGMLFLRETTLCLDGASPRSRLTRELVQAFTVAPGLPVLADTLAAVVWPDRSGGDDIARGRLKVAIHRLRAAGLPVVTLGRGYAIDPRATFVELAPARS
jgi:hypothetical protein